MADFNRKVINPLFNNAVTGGTIEDFSQNALLLPAMEKPPVAPVLNLSQDPPPTQGNFNLPTSSISTFHNEQPFEITTEPSIQQPFLSESFQTESPQPSNLSSVFSSFSNILKLNPNPENPPINDSAPPPTGVEALLEQPPTTIAPVPLFPVTGITNVPPVTAQHGPTNTYRRSGLGKRPVYAQIPGLSNQQSIPSQASNLFNPPPPQASTYFNSPGFEVPQPSSIQVPSAVSSNPDVPASNYFKPISPQPNSFLDEVASPVPAFSQNSSSVQSPVMTGNEMQPNLEAIFSSVDGEPPVNGTNQIYRPVYHHWFFKKEVEGKVLWQPFSMMDSLALEQEFVSNDVDPDNVVATDGGRFDVNILRRQRLPVYWTGLPTEVRRCSWFHKHSKDSKYIPYEENIATKLEEEFKIAFESNVWHRRVELPNGETVVFHAPDTLVLFPQAESPDAWGNTPQTKARVVKRGMDEFDVDEGEPSTVDHLLFMVHGIGSVCDLKFRSIEEVVDEFRGISLQLVQSHYKSSCERGTVNRIEVLPISWHKELHGEDTGIDQKLKSITLESIPRLRDFTNDTLLDILFYTSPVYCQTIVSTVGNELNRIYELFKQRNPVFNGGISLGGHSLGSLVLFDLLCHQQPEPQPSPTLEGDDVAPLNGRPLKRQVSRRVSYMMGTGGTGQPQINYPSLAFNPKAFFALGSPIGMFVTVRGLDTLGEQFALPTCPAFFNIFHPYDPVAYRIESLINPDLAKLKPVLIPHHKGRKRMHLELKETMARVGADLKQRVIDSMRNTWNSFFQIATFQRQESTSLEEEVDKALQEQIRQRENETSEEPDQQLTDQSFGVLNKNRRIDYVLQEAPFEIFNEYIFALTSHVCYWESEDTMLLVLKEIYDEMGVAADNKIPQQTMSIERPSSSQTPRFEEAPKTGAAIGMDPTMPVQQNVNIGPPPISGFVKKT